LYKLLIKGKLSKKLRELNKRIMYYLRQYSIKLMKFALILSITKISTIL